MADKDEETAGAEAEDFATMFAASEKAGARRRAVEVGQLVRGNVVAIGKTSAFVAIGGKGEATIDLAELRDPATGELTLNVGDELEATVTDDGRESGAIVLRRTLGRGGGHVPAELEQAREHGIPIEGLVTGENKGGFDVQIGSIRAFCPGSQIDRRQSGPRVPSSSYIGQRLQFRVTKIEARGRNVVVSRRDLLEEEDAEQARETWEKLQVGAVMHGTVTSIRDFGAFVDLGGVEGMIHVSELGYGRIGKPSEVLEVGQEVEAQVIKIESGEGGRRRVGLSLKALAADPWATAAEQFAPGAEVEGTVRRVEAFGAFVEIAPGLEGLAHVSKLALDRRLSHARQAVEVGQRVEATVLEIDPQRRRISLSLVESARRARELQAAAEHAEEREALARTNKPRSLGTLGDLLGEARKKKQ